MIDKGFKSVQVSARVWLFFNPHGAVQKMKAAKRRKAGEAIATTNGRRKILRKDCRVTSNNPVKLCVNSAFSAPL
jgi:hypothetical protein